MHARSTLRHCSHVDYPVSSRSLTRKMVHSHSLATCGLKSPISISVQDPFILLPSRISQDIVITQVLKGDREANQQALSIYRQTHPRTNSATATIKSTTQALTSSSCPHSPKSSHSPPPPQQIAAPTTSTIAKTTKPSTPASTPSQLTLQVSLHHRAAQTKSARTARSRFGAAGAMLGGKIFAACVVWCGVVWCEV